MKTIAILLFILSLNVFADGNPRCEIWSLWLVESTNAENETIQKVLDGEVHFTPETGETDYNIMGTFQSPDGVTEITVNRVGVDTFDMRLFYKIERNGLVEYLGDSIRITSHASDLVSAILTVTDPFTHEYREFQVYCDL